jgi:hypothetical protein
VQSLFKTELVSFDGVALTVRELSAADHIEISGKPPGDVAPVLCKACVAEWADETVETLVANVPARLMLDIAARVFRLSGIDEAKNSERTTSAGSSSV